MLQRLPGGLAPLLLAVLLAAGCGRGGGPAAATEEEFFRQSNLGKAAHDGGRFDDAIAAFTRTVELQPTHPDARQNLANALLRAGRPAEAAAQARELLALNLSPGAAHYLLGATASPPRR
jgi:tetratricopeptide (TPR) repeat protein